MPRAEVPKYFANQPYVLEQDFSSLASFTISGSPAIAEIVTDKVLTGTGSLRLQASGAVEATADWNTVPFKIPTGVPFNVTFRYWLPAATNVASFLIYLSTTNTFSAGTWTNALVSSVDGGEDQVGFRTGWSTFNLTRASFTGGTPTVLDNPANTFIFARLRLEVSKGPVTFDSIYIGGKSSCVLMMQFDDGSDTIFTPNGAVYGGSHSAASYMNSLGIKGTQNINKALVGTAGYLTIAQLNTLYNTYGWDITNHTTNHTNITTLTDAQIIAELSENDDFIAANGWERGRKHAFTVNTHPAFIRSLGYKTARSIQQVLINDQFLPVNMHNLWMHGVNNTVSSATVIARLNQARKEGRMAGVYIHALGTPESASTWDPVKHKAVVDDMWQKEKTGLSTNMTISEWYDGLLSPRRAA